MSLNQSVVTGAILLPRQMKPLLPFKRTYRANQLHSIMKLGSTSAVTLKLYLLDGVPVTGERFNALEALDFFLNEVDDYEEFRIEKNTPYCFRISAVSGNSVMRSFKVNRLSIKSKTFNPTKESVI
jgi:hypothetical protein